MIRQVGPLMFLIIFKSIERLWDALIKALHILHASKLNLLNKIKDLQSIYITKLIQIDPITCVKYYNHVTSCLCKLIAKDHYLLSILLIFFVIEFKNCGSEHDH